MRFPATGWGLPYEYGYDEPEIMLPAIRLIREGIYIPYKFDYGPLNGYIHAAWAALSFIRGTGEGRFPDSIWGIQTDNVTGWYWSVTSDWLLRQARYLSVLLSLVSVAFIYLAAYQLWKRLLPAAWAAAVLGLNATFAYQTSVVSADATTIAAACICLWASVHIYTSRARWAYALAGIAAAATLAFKYNNVFIVILPLAAHWLAPNQQSRSYTQYAGPVRYLVCLAIFAVLFLFPIFLKPVKFFSDVANLLSYYIVPQDSNLVSVITGYVQRLLALLDMGSLQVPGKNLTSFSQINFDFTWYGIGVVLVTFAGIVLCALRDKRLFLFLFPVMFLNFTNVGGDTGFFYPRYLLLSLPFLALFGAYAWTALPRFKITHKLPATAYAFAALVLLLPYVYHPYKNMRTMSSIVDPRTSMAEYLWTNVPEGKSLLILEETRWKVTPEESKRWNISKATVPQILMSPDRLSQVDFVIAPTKLFFHSPSPERSALVANINEWLDTLTSATAEFGSEPIAFDGPDVQPGVRLISSGALPSIKAEIPEKRVEGLAFGGPVGSYALGNGVLALRNGATLSARMEVPTTASQVTVRAQGTSPYQQKIQPKVEVTFRPVQGAVPPASATITMGRNQSGIHDYSAPVTLSPGTYQVSVTARDEDNFLTRLEAVSVQP